MEININNNTAAYLKEKVAQTNKNLFVRVYIRGVSWGSVTLGLALDELKKEDHVYEVNGVKVIIDKKTNKQVKGIKIDAVDTIMGTRFIVEDLYKAKGGCC